MKTYTLYLQNGKLKSENLFLLTDNYFLNGFERSFDEQFEGIVTQKGIFIKEIGIKEIINLSDTKITHMPRNGKKFIQRIEERYFTSGAFDATTALRNGIVARIQFPYNETKKILPILSPHFLSFAVMENEYEENLWSFSGITTLKLSELRGIIKQTLNI